MFFLDVSDGRSFSNESVQTCRRKTKSESHLMYPLYVLKLYIYRLKLYLIPSTNNKWDTLVVRKDCEYLQNEVHHSFIGLEKQLLKANTQNFSFQSISDGIADTQFVANLIQT